MMIASRLFLVSLDFPQQRFSCARKAAFSSSRNPARPVSPAHVERLGGGAPRSHLLQAGPTQDLLSDAERNNMKRGPTDRSAPF
jgi:hypothetical protein